MADGFVIFRDPADGRKQGFRGKFFPAGTEFFPAPERCFLIQPWDETASPECIIPESHNTENKDFQLWLETVEPGDPRKIFQADPQFFKNYIDAIQAEFSLNHLEKVVAARCRLFECLRSRWLDAFHNACLHYPTAFVYLFYHPFYGLWLGATPETLLNVNGEMAETMALAGTLKAGDHHWTGKEIEEQGVTGRYIEEVLLSNHCTFDKEAMTTTQAGPLRHLLTRYHFSILHHRVNKLIRDLHPTPAVCGYPKSSARDFIQKHEQLERGLYTGWIGWAEGEILRTWVNLRCARIFENSAVLFAGCGINSGSDPDREWKETEAKMEVIGRCL